MYSTSDLFYKLLDMGLCLKGLLTMVYGLEKDEEIIDWKTTDGSPTKVTLKKHQEMDTMRTLWEIREWE